MASEKTRSRKNKLFPTLTKRVADYADYIHASWTLEDFQELVPVQVRAEETGELNQYLNSLYTNQPYRH